MHTARRGQQMNHLPGLFIVPDSNNITLSPQLHLPSTFITSFLLKLEAPESLLFPIELTWFNRCLAIPCILFSTPEIEPGDEFYSIESITDDIKEEIGFTPGINCNMDSEHNSWLYQVDICINASGSDLI
ncbi:uncharacterized protein LOC107642185 [Arachis ipaensis]|uniref:Uncharacterized protein n=1 Tax=Arachis hypogaea TaxID=3818 RepID=A0A444YYR9_ARAHY|nr:uncharacterized protein LOC107642185 [Arachis ipaensis]XP_025656549.1 uncharacterized protein LOC112751577 [Arachis hypogaea]QHO14006.1 Ribonuclease [Arachis hypogaea]RYR06964.1 hypothetical protein Ahy_B05g074284 [Arachis hypogaea]